MRTAANLFLFQVLSNALRDLAKFERAHEERPLDDHQPRTYLADEPTRDVFTVGLDQALSAAPDSAEPVLPVWRQEKNPWQKNAQQGRGM